MDFNCQITRNALVGVEGQNPIVVSKLCGVVLLSAIARPASMDDSVRVALSPLDRAVRAAAVDHDDLVGPTDRFERGIDVRGFVQSDDDNR